METFASLNHRVVNKEKKCFLVENAGYNLTRLLPSSMGILTSVQFEHSFSSTSLIFIKQ